MSMTRDSWIWTVGLLGAIVVGLATLGDPTQYGIPAAWVPYLRLGAFLAGVVSGYFKASPLPHSGLR